MRYANLIWPICVCLASATFVFLVFWFPEVKAVLRRWDAVIPPLVNMVPLLSSHFIRSSIQSRTSRFLYYLILVVFSGFIFQFFYHFASVPRVRFFELTGATVVYAGFLFVVLSEVLIAGFGAVLTRWRGENWVKELDYVYLALGALGLAMSTNRLEMVDEKMSLPEYLGPFAIATALVVRAIKTRSEINGWNRA